MVRFFDQANYDILSRRKGAAGIALLFILPGLLLLAFRGLNLSIEFTGGTLIVVEAATAEMDESSIRAALDAAGIGGAEIQAFGTENEYAIRARLEGGAEGTEETTQQTQAAVDRALQDTFGADSYRTILSEAVGPKVGGELRNRASMALLLGFGAIFLYLWVRYEWRFGMAAVLAAVHDIFATGAFLAYLNLEVSLFVVASLLLIIGYSLNDTIVTFDRVRENLRKYKREKLYEILNRSINETLPRTVLTSGTTLSASIALVVLGGEVLSGPLIVVTFGIITGTFSSIFIAAPILLLVEHRWPGDDVRGARDIGGREARVVSAPRASA
jgi:preprotein translocase subunit SecF